MKDEATLGKEVLKIFNDHGYEAYFVGGFVRDFLLGIPSMDIDIATQATPDEVARLFEKTKETGLKFGTVTVFYQTAAFEVTTFRTEGGYADNRHPINVNYAKNLQEDLIRRDFTVNALAMDRFGHLIDIATGLSDLKTKTLRAIGDSDTRFKEDALRILRAFRFVAKLNFTIEPATRQSICRNHPLLGHISVERIMQELKTLIGYPYASHAFRAMLECGLPVTLPDLSSGIRRMADYAGASFGILPFYALCFYENGGDIPDYWRFSNKEKAIVSELIEIVTVTESDPYDPILVYAHGLSACLAANAIGRLLRPGSDQERRIREIDQNLPIHKTCDLKYKGQDLLQSTQIRDARIIGEIIGDLTLAVITSQIPNEYQALESYAKERIRAIEAGGDDLGN